MTAEAPIFRRNPARRRIAVTDHIHRRVNVVVDLQRDGRTLRHERGTVVGYAHQPYNGNSGGGHLVLCREPDGDLVVISLAIVRSIDGTP